MAAPAPQAAVERGGAAGAPWSLWLAWVLAVGFLALHVVGPDGPPRATWGIAMWEWWPRSARIAVAALAGVLALPPVVALWVRALARAGESFAERDVPRAVRGTLAAGFAVLCWIGRSGDIFYGDGIVIAKVARNTKVLLHFAGMSHGRANAEQIVEFLIHRGANLVFGPLFGLESYDTIALTHAICGGVLVYLLTALGIAWWPGHGRRQLAATGLFCTLGVVQLWFGHLETYTIGSTLFVGFLWAGTRALRGRAGLWQPTAWAAAATTVHPVFGGVLLGLGWVWLVRTRGAPWAARLRAAAWLVVPPAVAVTAFIVAYLALGFSFHMIVDFVHRGANEGATFVPLHQTTNVMERYTFFSLGHLGDLVNESLLTGAYALPLLLGLLVARGTRPFRDDPVPLFLLASTLVYWAVIVVINPPGGGRKEWDVFSPPAIGYGLLAIYLLFTSLDNARARTALAGLCFVVGLAHTGPWIVQNARIDLPARIDHYARGQLAQREGRLNEALAEYREALRILPTPELAVTCADLARRLGRDALALDLYANAVRWENRSELAAFGPWEHALVSMGEIREARGESAAAAARYREALAVATERHSTDAVAPVLARAHWGLARLALTAGDAAAACGHFDRALALDPTNAVVRTAARRACDPESAP